MKKLVKNPIFTLILGLLISSSITTVIAANYLASTVAYTPQDTNWKVNDVASALNELYTINNTTISNLNTTVSNLNKRISDSGNVAYGTISVTSQQYYSVTTNFKPSKVIIFIPNSDGGYLGITIYEKTVSSTNFVGCWSNIIYNPNTIEYGVSYSECVNYSGNMIINDTGFQYRPTDASITSYGTYYYYAIK